LLVAVQQENTGHAGKRPVTLVSGCISIRFSNHSDENRSACRPAGFLSRRCNRHAKESRALGPVGSGRRAPVARARSNQCKGRSMTVRCKRSAIWRFMARRLRHQGSNLDLVAQNLLALGVSARVLSGPRGPWLGRGTSTISFLTRWTHELSPLMLPCEGRSKGGMIVCTSSGTSRIGCAGLIRDPARLMCLQRPPHSDIRR
jgi:hypothetical protein